LARDLAGYLSAADDAGMGEWVITGLRLAPGRLISTEQSFSHARDWIEEPL